MKQDIYDFVKKWIEADKEAGPQGKEYLQVWANRFREAGYFELRLPADQCSTTDITSWHETTTNFRFIGFDESWAKDTPLANFKYFFFNTEQDKIFFILRWM